MCTTSDDGSYAYIDGDEVVSNGGLHGPRKICGKAELVSGEHEVRITFFGKPSQVAQSQKTNTEKPLRPSRDQMHATSSPVHKICCVSDGSLWGMNEHAL